MLKSLGGLIPLSNLKWFGPRSLAQTTRVLCSGSSAVKQTQFKSDKIAIMGESYDVDSCTNVTPRVTSKIGRRLHNQRNHPINLVRQRIQNYFYANFTNRSGNPLFAVFDNLSPVVTPYQNFDSLLVPFDHASRSPTDTYYVNSKYMLRSHTSAHDEELMKMGFNTFLVVGDVYRRDEIDSSHYPAFHQMDGVKLFTEQEVFRRVKDAVGLTILEKGKRTDDKQELHTMDAAKLLEYDLKQTLIGLAFKLFGKDMQYRWVNCYFPFTHPSWELEIFYKDSWLEVLGCGILEQRILNNAGADSKVGWAFGLGVDRLAMAQYGIPDIRLLWSEDSRFLDQFNVENPDMPVVYKPISKHLPRINDMSFWITDSFVSSDFYDVVRSVGGDAVEKVTLVDTFTHAKTSRTSHCYSITYQHMERPISQEEVTEIHRRIAATAVNQLGIELR